MPQENKLELLMQQLLWNLQKAATNFNVKVDSMYNDLNNKFEFLSTHVKKLDIQVIQIAEVVKRPSGTLPGKVEQNRKNKYVNAITLRIGKELEHNTKEKRADAENTMEKEEAEIGIVPKQPNEDMAPPPHSTFF